MNPLIVAVVNQSTVESDADVKARLPALDDQNNLDLSPIWQIPMTQRVFVEKGATTLPAGTQRLELILDNADQAGALGYHTDGGKDKIPTSYIFSKTTLAEGALPSVVHSHEACEAAVDPFIGSVFMIDLQAGGFRGGYGAVVMMEVSDAPEADQYGYKRNGIQLSNFITPGWCSMPWTPPAGFKTGPFDFVGNVSRPFGLTNRGAPLGLNPGGYQALRLVRIQRDWFQVTAAHGPAIAAMEAALPPEAPHVIKEDGTLLPPESICPFSRRGRWLAQHGGQVGTQNK